MGQKKRLWKKSEIDEIINLYTVKEYKMSEIGKKFASSGNTISGILKKNNIQNNRRTQEDKRVFNSRYFENIDTEEKAYFLGLLYTDGCVQKYKMGNPRISLRLTESDKPIIDRFKKCIGSDNSVYYCKEKNRIGLFGFSIRSKEMSDDLEKYGIIPNKTYLIKKIPKVSDELLLPFFRGLIDGDGSIYYSNKHWSIMFCNYSKEVCEEFQKILNKLIEKENEVKILFSKNPKGSCFMVQYQKKDTIKICKLLYKDSNIHIARKYEKAMLAINEDN